jgi:outer membrane protein TolC
MRPRSWIARLAACAVAALAATASADEPRALTHDAALRLAAERNAGLLVAGLERARLDAVAETARAPYLPQLKVEAAARENGTAADRTRALETTGTLAYASPYGQTVTVAGTVTAPLSPEQKAGKALTIDVSQALLRAGPYGGASDLKQADLDARIAREQYRVALNSLLRQADRAYWELSFARDEVEIKRRSRDRAKSQFEETRENIRRGLLAPGEIYVVEENVVSFEDLLSRAEENLALAESGLRRLLILPPAARVAAVTQLDVGAATDPSEADSQGVAVAKSPAVLAARLSVDRASVGVGGEVQKALPQVDLFGHFGLSSGFDTLLYVPNERQIRGGLRVSLPFWWGPDTARVRRAQTELRQRRADLQDAENAAATAVHEAALKVTARVQRLGLASRLVDLGQKKLDNEREKYKSGLSTLADVVRFQRDLDSALSNANRAKVDVLAARAELLAARGDLHDAVAVSVR